MLPKEAIEEFKRLYKEHFKVDLSDEEASRRANNLVNLYGAVYGDSLGTTAKSEGKSFGQYQK